MHALQIHQPEPRNLHRALTIRDFQILKFLWEMKFADGLTLHYGFFQTHKDNSQRTSTKYAINRLTKLKALGCVDREAVLGYPTKLFRLTKFGASLLQSNCPEIEVNYDRQPIHIWYATNLAFSLLISKPIGKQLNMSYRFVIIAHACKISGCSLVAILRFPLNITLWPGARPTNSKIG